MCLVIIVHCIKFLFYITVINVLYITYYSTVNNQAFLLYNIHRNQSI